MTSNVDPQPVNCSLLYAIIEDGLGRMLEIVKSDDFLFDVNGQTFASTLAEAVLISPKVYQSLHSDRSVRTFTVRDTAIDRFCFSQFLELIRGRDYFALSVDTALLFLPLCRLLGTGRLALILLVSLLSTSGATALTFCDVNIDDCASQFYSYSVDALRLLDKQMLHSLLGSPLLKIKTDDALLNTLIDLGSDYFEFWRYVEVSLLTTEGVSLFVEKLPFDELTIESWVKIGDRLTGGDHKLRSRRATIAFQSVILTEIPPFLAELRSTKWTLLYRGTRDGFSSANFHSKCNGQANTVAVILTTNGFVFGGFTTVVWDSSNSYKGDNTSRSFVFTVKNPRNSEPTKFPISNLQCAIYCHESHGPTFGNHCIYISNNCNANNSSYTALGNSYTNLTGLDGQKIFTGENYFTVKEIEVFSIDD
jgi:hypothetical protein